jgi:ABC-type glycerol-3-phosphate transport system substrate-binding protein
MTRSRVQYIRRRAAAAAGPRWCLLAFLIAATAAACTPSPADVLTFSGSVVGREGEVLRRQLDRFEQSRPGVRVAVRPTPDAADARHQLYVQWLNAHAPEPDVLQLDVVWVAEFAAAGWIERLDRYQPPVDDFFPAAVSAGRWDGGLYALPWFVDVGMLYRRTDLVPHAPGSLDDLIDLASDAQRVHAIPFGIVWQAARYEGLVTLFLEVLGAFGGEIIDADGRVAVDSQAAVRALTYLHDAIHVDRVAPAAVLTWQEEQTRLAFQSGQAVFMRNWPYASALLEDPGQSAVRGRFAVSSMPAGPGGAPTAALGGAALAVNARSRHSDTAYALIAFLLEPEQMLERARTAGQFPTRPGLFGSRELADALSVSAADALSVIERAVPRPVTPVYSELSEILQISLHRALTRQQEPSEALHEAASAMRALLVRVRLTPDSR